MKKEVLKYVIVFFGLMAIFVSFATLSSLLPPERIKKNIVKTVDNMALQQDYPFAIIPQKPYTMDNFTDALVLSQNYAIDHTKPFNAAMCLNFAYDQNMTKSLQKQVTSEPCLTNYVRYWHGNTFLLRPFLFFTDYETIRWILYVVSNILMLILGIKLYQTLGMKKAIAFTLGLLFVNLFVTQFSIQFFTTVNLAVIVSILMCLYFNQRKKILLISFITGCLTAYFDVLTTPIFTCGLPLIVYISAKTDENFKKRVTTLLLFSMLWAAGYGLMWFSKWTLATLFTDINALKDGFNTFLYRTSSEDFSRFEVIKQIFSMQHTFFLCLIITLLLPLVLFFFNKKEIETNLLLSIVGIYPFLWYLFAAQHSIWHDWFTYRTLAVFIIALFFVLINFISWNKIAQLGAKKTKNQP
jgi:hypothetical protein